MIEQNRFSESSNMAQEELTKIRGYNRLDTYQKDTLLHLATNLILAEEEQTPSDERINYLEGVVREIRNSITAKIPNRILHAVLDRGFLKIGGGG